MKITRHIAPDMRQALKAVREILGPDAVILSSRRTAEGVEVTAAMDFDAEALTSAPAAAPPLKAAPEPAIATAQSPGNAPRDGAPSFASLLARGELNDEIARADASSLAAAIAPLAPTAPIAPLAAATPVAPLAAAAAAAPLAATASAAANDGADATSHAGDDAAELLERTARAVAADRGSPDSGELPGVAAVAAVQSELKSLRRMLETQLAQLAWKDLARRAPIHTEMLRELTEVGIAPDLAGEVVAQVPHGADLAQARRLAIAGIAQRLIVTGDRWLQQGGTVALIGPTGVGKTTTLAKLAVRWVLHHGPRELALVAADAVRMGAQDQVQSLGQLLGAQVFALDDVSELPALLGRLGRRRFVLIDTPGSSQRDAQLAGRLASLAAAGRDLEIALVLAASTQAGAIAETVARFAPAQPSSCVLTKVDEAASLGGVLSVLMRARLPISYVSEGQRVPEDLRPARTLELVSSAVQLAQTSGAAADEDLLKRRFAEVAHAIA